MALNLHQALERIFSGDHTVAGFDATGSNEHMAPRGAQMAGYDTGSGGIPWTESQYKAHPGAVHIDQNAGASDFLSDVLDVERGAATPAECPGWSVHARANFSQAIRPGQREPAIYTSADNVTNVVNELVGARISNIGLWVANWNLTEKQAIDDVLAAAGPYPIIGVQYGSGTWGDFDVWSQDWLSFVSGIPVASNPVPSLAIAGRGFTHLDVSWDAEAAASSYTVRAYWPATNGREVFRADMSASPCRVRNLLPIHTYEIKVRAHPGGSTGTDASVHGTTR